MKTISKIGIIILIILNSINLYSQETDTTYFIYGYTKLQEEKIDEAIINFEKVVEINPDFELAWYALGYIYNEQSNPDDAINCFKEVIRINPKNEEANYELGEYYFFKSKFDEALLYLENALIANPKNENANFITGYIYMKKGEYTSSLNYFNITTEINPEKTGTYNLMGAINSELEQYQKAIKNYTNAISLEPEKASYYNSRAWARCFVGSDFENALSDVNKALELEDEKSSIAAYYDTKATIYALKGNLSKALNDLNSAINNEEKALYYYKRGLVNKELDNIDKAKKDFETAKDMDNEMSYKTVKDPLFKIYNDIIPDTNPPVIEIVYPNISRGFIPVEETKEITIKGNVSDENGVFEVTVNNIEVIIDTYGNFSKTVLLAYGNNSFTIIAKDINQNIATETFVIERQTNQEEIISNNEIDNESPFQNGKYYALIIGNNDYQDISITSLDKPIDDATELYNVLTTEYTFDEENVTFLKNATYVEMIEAFDNLSNNLTENDNLLVFYAGHGWWDETKQLGYWLPADAKQNSTAFWIANSRISDYMSSINTKHTLLIADACFSGSIFKTRSAFADAGQAINSLYELPSRTAMTSGNLKEVPDKSVFLEYLVKRLDNNTEKYLSADQLFVSFRIAVMNNSETEPQFGTIQNAGDEGGEFIFIRRDK